MSDPRYKILFACPRMVRDLLLALVWLLRASPSAPGAFLPGRDWAERVDFSTLHEVPSEFTADDLTQRRADTVWQVKVGKNRRRVLVLLEFQTKSDPKMAWRIHTYTGLLYRELERNKDLPSLGEWPRSLAVVLYTGDAPWNVATELKALFDPEDPWLDQYLLAQHYVLFDARRLKAEDLPAGNLMSAIVGLEQSRSLADLRRVAGELCENLAGEPNRDLRGAFADWLRDLARKFLPDGEALPRELTLEAPNLEDMKMTLEERVAEWPKQWREEGRQEGFRALLRRQAALRFDADIGQRLAALIEDVDDEERLAQAGEAIIKSATGAELLERVRRARSARG